MVSVCTLCASCREHVYSCISYLLTVLCCGFDVSRFIPAYCVFIPVMLPMQPCLF